MLIYKYAAPLGLNNMVLQTVQGCGQIGGVRVKLVNLLGNLFPFWDDNTTSGNMDELIGYSYTGISNGEVVVIYWAGCSREYRNNPLIWMR